MAAHHAVASSSPAVCINRAISPAMADGANVAFACTAANVDAIASSEGDVNPMSSREYPFINAQGNCHPYRSQK